MGAGITNPYGQTKYFIEKFLEVRFLILTGGIIVRTCAVHRSNADAYVFAHPLLSGMDGEQDFQRSPEGKAFKVVVLRYFNPVGAHER